MAITMTQEQYEAFMRLSDVLRGAIDQESIQKDIEIIASKIKIEHAEQNKEESE